MFKLIVDVGNTQTKFGFFKNNHLLRVYHLHTNGMTSTSIVKTLPHHIEHLTIDKIFVGSVAPSKNALLQRTLMKIYKVKPVIIKAIDFASEFNLKPFNSSEIGLDILGLALYVKLKNGKGIGISFGTATFAVAVNNRTIYGVSIAPSISIGIRSLDTITELTSSASYQKTKLVSTLELGNNTEAALLSGGSHMALGFVLSVQRYCEKRYGIHEVFISGGKTQYMGFVNKMKHVQIVDNGVLLGYNKITN